jgi:aminopeptidase-like protein
MKIGVHTIKGKTDKEVLLFAHLDHPYQANDNLSGVVCLINMAKAIKKANLEHTVKLVFCPETIGSIGYALTQDISKVDFVISVDCVGNDETLLFQKSYNLDDVLNKAAHLAVSWQGVSYRKGMFRHLIGSDEYVFNDPKIGIPAIMFSRWSDKWKEYHTSEDTPDKINEKKIKEVQKVILKTIDIMEKNFVPVRNFKAPLFREKYGLFMDSHLMNRDMDYLIFDMDGKKSIVELTMPLGLSFDFVYQTVKKLQDENLCSNLSKIEKR